MVQEDITKMEHALEQLKAAGTDLFADEITALQGRIVAAHDELAAEADKAAREVSKEAADAKDEIDSWWVSHRNDVYHVIEIAALLYIIIRLVG